MWLIGSFFTWHILKFFLLKNVRLRRIVIFPMRTPLPIVDERTAKVGVRLQILDLRFEIL